MSRKAKAKATTQTINAAVHGFTSIRFESPKLCRAALADRGHCYMTGAEYREHRMSRGRMSTCRLETTIELRAMIHRMQRIAGGRRITGLAAGTKKPASWQTAGTFERAITRR